jgi:hypothetical protein
MAWVAALFPNGIEGADQRDIATARTDIVLWGNRGPTVPSGEAFPLERCR